MTMTEFSTPEPLSLTIDLACVGDVRVIAADSTTTTVDVRPRDTERAADVRAAEQVTVDLTGTVLQLTGPRSWRASSFFGNGGAVHITITLPTGSHLSADLAMGRIDAEGQLDACRIKTTMGNVQLDRTGPLQLTTGYGDIAIGSVAGDAEISTGSGSLRVTRIDGSAVIKNSNGDTQLGVISGTVQVKSANGSISLVRAHDSVDAKTASGSLRVGGVERGSIALETAYGDVEIGIHSGTAAWVDASSKLGTVRNELESSGTPSDDDLTVEVRARTSYGDITIHRASA